MRKKLDTRFPASRIKKIMQADEDVGKIAMAVPLLVSKALELFLQDLCDRTYDITLHRGAKTMSALHLKHCVQSFNVFDFLRGIVIKVPDMGGPDASGEDRLIPRRRKAVDDEEIDMDDEFKRSKIHEVGHSSSGRGRGRCRGRGRGRASRAAERESILYEKCEDDPDISLHDGDKLNRHPERVENAIEAKEMKNMFSRDNTAAQKFDLNTVLDENGDSSALKEKENGDSTAAATSIPEQEMKHEYLGWPFSDMDRMAIDPIQLAQLNGRIDDEEDYDEER